MKQKVHTLFTEKDFKLIGIASHLSVHKLSWLLNEQMNAKFQQSEPLVSNDKGSNEELKFTTFKYEDEGSSLYTLYSNRTGQAILVKSVKNIDFILKYEGDMSGTQFQGYIDKLKKLKNILTAYEIDANNLKAKELDLFV